MARIHAAVGGLALVTLCGCGGAQPANYDLVIAGGRVMDPESQLDEIKHVGIGRGRIEVISNTPLQGTRVIDASNHVVAPGFIDLHEHGQQEAQYALMVRDGVTSAFELEVGTADVVAGTPRATSDRSSTTVCRLAISRSA
jgi:predicted amidohydrolase